MFSINQLANSENATAKINTRSGNYSEEETSGNEPAATNPRISLFTQIRMNFLNEFLMIVESDCDYARNVENRELSTQEPKLRGVR